MCTKYNGWTNRETWCVNLWLTNDEGDYKWLTEIINDHGTFGESAQRLKDELNDIINDVCYHEAGKQKISGMFIDMLRASFALVDFREIIINNQELKELEPEPTD